MVRNGSFLYIIFSKNYFLNGNHIIMEIFFCKSWFSFQVEIKKNLLSNSCQYPLKNYLSVKGYAKAVPALLFSDLMYIFRYFTIRKKVGYTHFPSFSRMFDCMVKIKYGKFWLHFTFKRFLFQTCLSTDWKFQVVIGL